MDGLPSVWGRVGGLLKRANRVPGLVIRVSDGEASLWFDERSGDRPYEEAGLGGPAEVGGKARMKPVSWDVSKIVGDGAGEDDDPARVILAGCTRFTVPGDYGDREIGGVSEWATFEEAVVAARSTVGRHAYPGLTPRDGDTVEDGVVVTYSNSCVALRQAWRDAPQGVALGSDAEVVRWTVTRDRVILHPVGWGLTGADVMAAQALGERECRGHGWA